MDRSMAIMNLPLRFVAAFRPSNEIANQLPITAEWPSDRFLNHNDETRELPQIMHKPNRRSSTSEKELIGDGAISIYAYWTVPCR
jgi:hypothetical protein